MLPKAPYWRQNTENPSNPPLGGYWGSILASITGWVACPAPPIFLHSPNHPFLGGFGVWQILTRPGRKEADARRWAGPVSQQRTGPLNSVMCRPPALSRSRCARKRSTLFRGLDRLARRPAVTEMLDALASHARQRGCCTSLLEGPPAAGKPRSGGVVQDKGH